MKYSLLNRSALVAPGVLLCSLNQAHAYIDPGSGSYLFQLVIAGLTGAVFFFTTTRRAIVATVRSWFKGTPKDESSNDKN